LAKGKKGSQHIYSRSFAQQHLITGDLRVNTFTNKSKVNPAIATLADGNLIVVWSSLNQKSTNSMQDIYGQRLSPTGVKLGVEFLINQFTSYNQRTPVVASLSDGRFLVAWVSEQERFQTSVDIYARLFTTTGSAAGNEFMVNTGTNVCANPSIAASPAYGGFLVAWSEHANTAPNTGWDVMVRAFANTLVGGAVTYPTRTLPATNTDRGWQHWGRTIWRSGPAWDRTAREGVFGQFLRGDGTHTGDEPRINTTTVSMQPPGWPRRLRAVPGGVVGSPEWPRAWTCIPASARLPNRWALRTLRMSPP
jgi:hypothetical protein